jgi:hypothetical protein
MATPLEEAVYASLDATNRELVRVPRSRKTIVGIKRVAEGLER